MAHVSRNELLPQIRKEIEQQLVRFYARGKGNSLFVELLTEVELLMLAKRLATILMLIDEQSYYRIEQALGVSVSTSKRLHGLLVGGAFERIEQAAKSRKEEREFTDTVVRLIHAGMPPRAYVIKKRKARV